MNGICKSGASYAILSASAVAIYCGEKTRRVVSAKKQFIYDDRRRRETKHLRRGRQQAQPDNSVKRLYGDFQLNMMDLGAAMTTSDNKDQVRCVCYKTMHD